MAPLDFFAQPEFRRRHANLALEAGLAARLGKPGDLGQPRDLDRLVEMIVDVAKDALHQRRGAAEKALMRSLDCPREVLQEQRLESQVREKEPGVSRPSAEDR